MTLSLQRKALVIFKVLSRLGFKYILELGKMAEEGHLKPVIDKVYPFQEFLQGFQHSKSGRARGKIVFSIGTNEQ